MSIWKYAERFSKNVPDQYRLENNAGGTPLIPFEVEGKQIYLKREDLNPTGSHKDRSLAFQISAHLAEAKTKLAISSSGNSVISAIYLIKDRPEITLDIFLSPKLNATKRARIERFLGMQLPEFSDSTVGNFKFHFTNKAVSESVKYAKQNQLTLLRGSQDPYALEGFKTLGYEVAETLPEVTDLFFPVSSGTTLIGTSMAFSGSVPRLHVCQTEAVNLIAREFDNEYSAASGSIADSIVDRVGHRRAEVIEAVKQSGGSGWVISDKEIEYALNLLKAEDINSSAEGALTLASYLKAASKGNQMKHVVCIISGVA